MLSLVRVTLAHVLVTVAIRRQFAHWSRAWDARGGRIRGSAPWVWGGICCLSDLQPIHSSVGLTCEAVSSDVMDEWGERW